MSRLTKDEYFMIMAKVAALRSVCKSRRVGAVLVDINGYVLSTGYNGPPKGFQECDPCKRVGLKIGESLDDCPSIHAEQNAILQCRDARSIDTLYVTSSPCVFCLKPLLNTPCKRIVFETLYPHPLSIEMWEKAGRIWTQFSGGTRASEILEFINFIG